MHTGDSITSSSRSGVGEGVYGILRQCECILLHDFLSIVPMVTLLAVVLLELRYVHEVLL